ncbi:MAG: lipoyl(octanoyl) transferase LipB, partial [Armatimonadota bacterium]|nr:lipoyl(octanoyl) transferase LipB [Armatimonadota bacterium]
MTAEPGAVVERWEQRVRELDPRTPASLVVVDLGLVPYRECLALQRRLAACRAQAQIPDVLLLCEHPPVFTIGRAADGSHLGPLPAGHTVPVVAVERGGDVTYHGPGQLVGYPILRLADHGDDVHRYVRMVEETAIVLLAQYGIETGRIKEYPGVWAGPAKIGAVGIAIKGGVTMHGLAINV